MAQILESDLHYRGPRGYSNYELAVQNGYIGTEEQWLEEQKQGAFQNYKADFDREYGNRVNTFDGHVEDKTDEALDILDNEIAKVTNGQIELDPNAEIIQARSGFTTLGKTLKQKIYHFANVAEMKACTNLVDGDVVQTLGYYEEDDGGSATYKIVDDNTLVDDKGSVHDLTNGLKAKLMAKSTINVKQFGAKGDGTNDDTTFINNALNFASEYSLDLIFSGGNYLISDTLNVLGAQNLNRPSICIKGVERESCKITANNTMGEMLLVSSKGNYTISVNLSNLHLYGNNMAEKGIAFDKSTSECSFTDIKIQECTTHGFYSINNFYLNRLNKVVVYQCPNGIYIPGGINTSINLQDCYCYGCTNAYRVGGIYCNLINCCADGSATNTVFNITGFRGSLIGCGSEAYRAEKMFIAGNRTYATIVGAYTWGNDTNEDAIHIDAGNGVLVFIGGYILGDRNEQDTIMPRKTF